MSAIDLNSDVGESLGPWSMGADAELIPLVTSVNVACGFHAGDPRTIERTVALARQSGAAIGAHPGYPDLIGFGRRDLDMDARDLEAAILYQIAAVAAFAHDAGADLMHVKPHGALYNAAARDAGIAEAIARAVRRFSADLVLVGLAGSVMLEAGSAQGLAVAGEAFADRAYEPDGRLRSRRLEGAILPEQAAASQAVSIARDGRVRAIHGTEVEVHAATICLHGDTPGATGYARAVRAALEAVGIAIRPLGSSR